MIFVFYILCAYPPYFMTFFMTLLHIPIYYVYLLLKWQVMSRSELGQICISTRSDKLFLQKSIWHIASLILFWHCTYFIFVFWLVLQILCLLFNEIWGLRRVFWNQSNFFLPSSYKSGIMTLYSYETTKRLMFRYYSLNLNK